MGSGRAWAWERETPGVSVKLDYIFATSIQNTGIRLFRPTTGTWSFDYSLDGITDKGFVPGQAADEIIAGKWA